MFSENPQFKDFEWPANPAWDNWKPVDGENVGNPDTSNEKLDKQDNGKQKETKTIAELGEEQNKSKLKIQNELSKNPDWPPASANPESAATEVATLESSLNGVA